MEVACDRDRSLACGVVTNRLGARCFGNLQMVHPDFDAADLEEELFDQPIS
jgi:hypothetical protein